MAHYILDCFEVLGALSDAHVMHQPHVHQPGGWIDVTYSLMH